MTLEDAVEAACELDRDLNGECRERGRRLQQRRDWHRDDSRQNC